jgi:hypothetical protein
MKLGAEEMEVGTAAAEVTAAATVVEVTVEEDMEVFGTRWEARDFAALGRVALY